MSLSRRGFGMLELVIALGLTGVVSVLVWTILSSAASRLRDRTERMGMEQALRATAAATRATIEPLGSDSTGGIDLASMAPDGLIARTVRGGGVVCGASPASLIVHDGSGWWSALRAPVAVRDSLLIATITLPARWIAIDLPWTPGSGSCPDGSPALVFRVVVPPAEVTSIGVGSPLRFFEPMEIRSYTASGATWLGLQGMTTAGVIQPLSGPFSGAGVGFTPLTSAGTVTGFPGSVGLIAVRAPALTERAHGLGVARMTAQQADSTTQSVALRNAP